MSDGPMPPVVSGGGSSPGPGFTLPPPRKSRKGLAGCLVMVLVVFVFIAGMLVGGALTLVVAVHRLRYAIHHPEQVPAKITAVLTRRLHLSREQAGQVRALIATRQARLQAIRRSVQPEVQSELEGLKKDVSGVLTPKQQAEWDKVYEEGVRTWLPPAPAGSGVTLPEVR